MERERPGADSSSQKGNTVMSNSSNSSSRSNGSSLKRPSGKLGVLIPGVGGAVSTTFIAGVEAIKKGLGRPIGSYTQFGTIENNGGSERLTDFIDLASLDSLVFSGWDIFPENCYEGATKAGVLERSLIDGLKAELSSIVPMSSVFEKKFVKNLDGQNIKTGKSKMDLANQLIHDIARFKETHSLDRLVMIWCASTEIFFTSGVVHDSIDNFEQGLEDSHPDIAPSMIYAYASIKSGVPFVNGSPSLSADIPALVELAESEGVPIVGKDFKTGQTLMKTILAPGLKTRMLGLNGWFSTNILGNRDGEVLDDPDAFKTKEESKLSVLDSILDKELYPELYSNYYHKVRINYYPPRGDDKESWDNIDIFGWLGYQMQIKINFLCRDSILAAPVVLDLVLLLDLAQRANLKGIQEWLGFYFKSPMVCQGLPVHDIFQQQGILKQALRNLKDGVDIVSSS